MLAGVFLFTDHLLFPPLPHLVKIPEGRIHTMPAKRVDENEFFFDTFALFPILESSPSRSFLEDISERPQELIPCRRLREGGSGNFIECAAVASTHNT